MKEVEVNGRKYRIEDIPPWFISKIRLYASLVGKTPSSYEEAEKMDNELEKVFTSLSKLVTPQPQTGDYVKVLNEVIRYWSETYTSISEEAEFFRQNRIGESGRTVSPTSPSKAISIDRVEGGG